VVDGAKLSQSQANRTLRRLIDSGALRMIGPKQRATYTLAQRTGSGTGNARPSATPSPAADAPATSRAPGSKAEAAGSEASAQASLAGRQSAGAWIRAADLRPQVGGTAEQLRLALVDLVRDGAIVKTGERNGTRYKLAG